MGKQTVVKITDDYSGQDLTEAEAEEITLTLIIKRHGEGTEDQPNPEIIRWEVIYSADSTGKLREALAPFLSGVPEETPSLAAVTKSANGGTGKSYAPDPRNVHIRAWWGSLTDGQRMDAGNLPAKKSDKGRIPDPVIAAYDNAQPVGYISA